MKILHITAHMGGGVGKALSDTLIHIKKMDGQDIHQVLCLQKAENEKYINKCKAEEINIFFSFNISEIKDIMEVSDLIILHWWHHPAMMKLFTEIKDVKCRMILWCHVSGCTYPELPFGLVDIMDAAFFTTPYTCDNPYWNEEERRKTSNKAKVVYGLGELNSEVRKTNYELSNDSFIIGYVGTLNFVKLNPDFCQYCKAVLDRIPNSVFVLVGDDKNKSELLEQASKLGISEKLIFTGYVENVINEYDHFDIFSYLLNPDHYGATENALLEAMIYGFPVIALDQCVERYIISNNNSGFLIDSVKNYSEKVYVLYQDIQLRMRMGENARNTVLKEYNIDKNINIMNKVFRQVEKNNKAIRDFTTIFGYTPHDNFLKCLGKYKNYFKEDSIDLDGIENNCPFLVTEKRKSSLIHFADYFPEDEVLQNWVKSVKKS